MTKALLLGLHTHPTRQGLHVHIWQRNGTYIARGRYGGRAFGKSLGADTTVAAGALMRLIVSIDDGTFLRPSEFRGRRLQKRPRGRFTIRQLADELLADSRRRCGKQTANDYYARLIPLLEYAEQSARSRRYPRADLIDRDFAVRFKNFLFERKVTRNGHPLADARLMSPRQIHNCLSSAAMLLNWGARRDIDHLPPDFVNPFTREICGERPMRDPLVKPKLDLTVRIALVQSMDAWQLCTFAWGFILPPRPDELAGLLINDVDRSTRQLMFGTRLGGNDFNKARATFQMLYPVELDAIVSQCVAGRAAGPLLRRRSVVEGRRRPPARATSLAEINHQYQSALATAKAGEVQCEQDRKRMFRALLGRLGAVSEDEMAKEFRTLLKHVWPDLRATFYDLRHAVPNDMKSAGVDYMFRLYVMGRPLEHLTQASYEGQDVHGQMSKYFLHIQPLLKAMAQRASALGLDRGRIGQL